MLGVWGSQATPANRNSSFVLAINFGAYTVFNSMWMTLKQMEIIVLAKLV